MNNDLIDIIAYKRFPFSASPQLYNNLPASKTSVSDTTLSIRMLALVGKLTYPGSGK